MEELANGPQLSARGRRALSLMALALAVLTAAGLVYLWPVLTVRSAGAALSLPGKGWLNTITFFDRNQGWAVLAGPLPSSAPSSILRTSDGGGHWKLTDVPGAPSYSLTRFFDPRHALVSVNTPVGQILYSTDDGGLNWKRFDLPGGPNDGFASFVFLDRERGWYLEGTPGTSGAQSSAEVQQAFVLWRTLDGGQSWSEVLAVDPAHPRAGELSLAGFKSALSFSDERHGLLLSTPSETFYLTQDGGLSWESRPLPPFPYALVGGDGRGASVRLLRLPGLLVEMVSVTVPGSATSLANVYTRVSDDGGSNWSALRPLPTNPSLSARPQFEDSRHWLLGEGHGIWRTADGGQTWVMRAAALPASLGISDFQLLAGGVMWVVAHGGSAPDRLLRSGDGGAHWEDRGAPSMQVVR
jgi:photosystem II stability/assembly factor-like uncharacterized protein